MPWGFLGSIGAALIGGALENKGASDANSAARQAAQVQMEFQERAAKSSYQWGMEDMRKAGLNPMLAYQRGGASSLSGTSYSPQNEMSGAPGAVGTAISTSMALIRQREEIKNMKEQRRVMEATRLKTESDKKHTDKLTNRLDIEVPGVKAESRTKQNTQRITRAQEMTAEANAASAKSRRDFQRTRAGRWTTYIGQFFSNMLSASHTAKTVRGLRN